MKYRVCNERFPISSKGRKVTHTTSNVVYTILVDKFFIQKTNSQHFDNFAILEYPVCFRIFGTPISFK